MQKELQTLGMSKNEAKVYEALAKFGLSRAGTLINKLDIHRNLVYQSLESLVAKGYATKLEKDKVWQFQITDPHSLLSTLENKKRILRSVIEEINTFQDKSYQQIVFYEGLESYRNYWIESLERFPEGTINYTVGTPPTNAWIELLGKKVWKKYSEIKKRKKARWHTILFELTQGEKEMLQKNPAITEYRLWPGKVGNCLGNFNVVHDTVILHSMNNPPKIIEIRDKDMVKIFKNYFDMMWEKSTPVALENFK